MYKKRPTISVIMPVYNASRFVAEAIKSVLIQTFSDFEFLIIDDGSTDNSKEIIEGYSDTRIKFISRCHKGLIDTLNELLGLSEGEYIARMDADDICEPERFAEQVKFLQKNQEIFLCGTWAKTIDGDAKIIGVFNYPPLTTYEIRKFLLLHNAFIHSSVMFKKDAQGAINGFYRKSYKFVEDYELWTRIAMRFQTANINKYLLKYRITALNITNTKKILMRIAGIRVRFLALIRLFKSFF